MLMDSSWLFRGVKSTLTAPWLVWVLRYGLSTVLLNSVRSVGDDMAVKMGIPFPRMMKIKPNETVIFSWITFKSRAHRDSVNAKVMKDPRLSDMDPKSMPFDMKRMAYGGFKILIRG